jgi:thiamine pyrophosphate-dependent acetolactate synthase large subunit-like protein
VNLDIFLTALNTVRREEVVITTMAASQAWPAHSSHPLDLNYVPSTMGQGPTLGLGIAMACPDRRVVVLNGDGCLLMNLGCLVTIAEQAPKNLILFNMDNGHYEVTGGQPIAGLGKTSFVGMAESAGWPVVVEMEEQGLRGQLEMILSSLGPVFVNVKLEMATGGSPDLTIPMPERIQSLSDHLNSD